MRLYKFDLFEAAVWEYMHSYSDKKYFSSKSTPLSFNI